MGLLCAAAAAAPAGKCACMGFAGRTFRRLWGMSVPFSLNAPLLCQTIVAILCGNFEQFANKRPAHEKTAEKSALLSSLNLKYSALHSKELLGDVGAALGVLGVPVRADFSAYSGVSTAPPTMILQSSCAACRAAMVSSMLFRVVVIRAERPTRCTSFSRTVSTTVSTGTSRPRSSTSKP